MDQAITVGGLVEFVLVIGGLFMLGALAFLILWITNPFRSGH